MELSTCLRAHCGMCQFVNGKQRAGRHCLFVRGWTCLLMGPAALVVGGGGGGESHPHSALSCTPSHARPLMHASSCMLACILSAGQMDTGRVLGGADFDLISRRESARKTLLVGGASPGDGPPRATFEESRATAATAGAVAGRPSLGARVRLARHTPPGGGRRPAPVPAGAPHDDDDGGHDDSHSDQEMQPDR